MLKFVKVEEVISLGLIVDNNLNWDNILHFAKVLGKKFIWYICP